MEEHKGHHRKFCGAILVCHDQLEMSCTAAFSQQGPTDPSLFHAEYIDCKVFIIPAIDIRVIGQTIEELVPQDELEMMCETLRSYAGDTEE